jgi:hypothetical protein
MEPTRRHVYYYQSTFCPKINQNQTAKFLITITLTKIIQHALNSKFMTIMQVSSLKEFLDIFAL